MTMLKFTVLLSVDL